MTNIKQRLAGFSKANQRCNGRFIMIDWTDSTVSAREMSVENGQVTVGTEFHATWPTAAIPSQSTEIAGIWLKQQLQQRGLTAKDAVVCLPRHEVSLRLLELPVVDDQELASLIALQVESQLESGAHEKQFDFLPQLSDSKINHRYALLATVSSETQRLIHETLTIAGLNIKASGVGELAVDSLAAEQCDELRISILANHSKVEFVASHQGIPLASHSAPMPADCSELLKTIPAVTQRMVAGLPAAFQNMALQQVNLLGPFAAKLQPDVQSVSECRVTAIDTPCNKAVRSYALLTAMCQPHGTLNFHSPRRPINHNQLRRQQWIRYTIGAAVLVGLLTWWAHDERTSLETQLAALSQDGRNLVELNERSQATLQRWKFVSSWQSSAVDWSSEVHRFSDFLPERTAGYLTRLQVEQPVGSTAPVIRAEGIARDAEVAMSLKRRLMSEGSNYQLEPHSIEPATRDADFGASYRIEASIQEPEESVSPPVVVRK